MRRNGVKVTLSPPYHKESNGAAERYEQEVKKNLVRQVLEADNPNLSLQHKIDNYLFAYRNTPTTSTGMTPAELFLNWKPRTQLTLLKPNLQIFIQENRERVKEASDRRRGQSRYFQEGQTVLVKTVCQEKVAWIPGKILVQRSPVTYEVSVLGRTPFCHADHPRARSDLSDDHEEDPVLYRRPLEPSQKELPVEEPTTRTTTVQQNPCRGSPTKSPEKPNLVQKSPETLPSQPSSPKETLHINAETFRAYCAEAIQP